MLVLREEDRCNARSRSMWPVRYYDGRWTCSLVNGHLGPHRAYLEHDTTGELRWLGGWVDGTDWKDEQSAEYGYPPEEIDDRPF